MAAGLRPGVALPTRDMRQWSRWCREQANVSDSLDHDRLTNNGTNTHAELDTHLANNAIHITGTVTVTTTSHTAADDHVILVDDDTAAAQVTVTLPASADGNQYHIKKLGTTANVVIDGNGSETIDGALTVTLSIQYDSIMIVADGANWHII